MAGRLTIIGGGVMGLMTAYHAAPLAESVTVLDRSRVGDPATASSEALVVTAGLGTNDVLGLVPGCPVRFPLRPDRPVQSKYFIPPAGSRAMYKETAMPVFAYLDIAPWVGRVLAQLALQRGTVYDIGRFTPARFAAEGVAS